MIHHCLFSYIMLLMPPSVLGLRHLAGELPTTAATIRTREMDGNTHVHSHFLLMIPWKSSQTLHCIWMKKNNQKNLTAGTDERKMVGGHFFRFLL